MSHCSRYLREHVLISRRSKRHDARTRHDRTERRNNDWALQLEDLVTAYLTWQANLTPPTEQEAEGMPFEITVVDFFGVFAFTH